MDEDRIAGSAKDVAGKIEEAVGDMADNSNAKLSGSVRQAAGKAQNLYGQAKDVARDAAKQVYSQSSDSSEAVVKLVQDNPLGSLLIAGGIGFALAALLMRQPTARLRRWRYYD